MFERQLTNRFQAVIFEKWSEENIDIEFGNFTTSSVKREKSQDQGQESGKTRRVHIYKSQSQQLCLQLKLTPRRPRGG